MVYRIMAEQIESLPLLNKNQSYALIGFNALNKCEKVLFDRLKNVGVAAFFWDYDRYYKDAGNHEAALFIEENLLRFPMPEDFSFATRNFEMLKAIEVVSIPGFSGQATYAANWIAENKEQISNRFDNTALVLCDETLLLPMLNSIPERVEELNITMGFPVKSSPAYALVKGLIDVDRNSRLNKNGELVFYYRNVLALLSNPLLKAHLGDFVDVLFEQIRIENKIYLTNADFGSHELLKLIFSLPNEAAECKDYLQTILKLLFSEADQADNLLKESLYQLFLAINRLRFAFYR